MSEQFRRVANVYFLALVILQSELRNFLPIWFLDLQGPLRPAVFSIFGATTPEIAMLPLVAILLITGIKDALEDARRHKLDNEVNNSAVTRLGDWANVNVPDDDRPWWAFWRRANPNHRLSKGVRKLREKEGEYDATFLYAGRPSAAESRETLGESAIQIAGPTARLRGNSSASGMHLPKVDSVHSLDSFANDSIVASYPPRLLRNGPSGTSSYAASSLGRSGRSTKAPDVVTYDQATPGTAKWERTLWKKLEVGDVVLLKENDQIPADVVVLSTSDSDGVCFVETKNLDGETNLKPRKALKATMGIVNEEDIEHARFCVDSEPPNANLYSYSAVLRWRSREEKLGTEHPIIEGQAYEAGEELQEPVTINELLLRGCQLRNTKWAIGLVVFTGADTKIMMNQGEPGRCVFLFASCADRPCVFPGETPSKRSKIEKETNFNVIINFLILVALCAACAVGGGVYNSMSGRSFDYYEPGGEFSRYAIANAFIIFGYGPHLLF